MKWFGTDGIGINILKKAVVICAAILWWGSIYPQFTMVKGTYEVVYEESAAEEGQGLKDGRGIYWEILAADRHQVRFKSKLIMEMKALRERLRGASPLAENVGRGE